MSDYKIEFLYGIHKIIRSHALAEEAAADDHSSINGFFSFHQLVINPFSYVTIYLITGIYKYI